MKFISFFCCCKKQNKLEKKHNVENQSNNYNYIKDKNKLIKEKLNVNEKPKYDYQYDCYYDHTQEVYYNEI